VAYRIQLPVSCDSIKEGNACARKWSNHRSECLDWAGFLAHRAPIESIGPKGTKDPKTNDTNVQDTMESSHGRRGNLGDGGIPQHQVSGIPAISKLWVLLPILFFLNQISGRDSV
jgi:hypothetical protein